MQTPIKQKDLDAKQRLLESKIKYIEVKKVQARQEYLRNLKCDMIANIKVYLLDVVEQCLLDNCEQMICKNQEKVRNLIQHLFDISINERIQNLENCFITRMKAVKLVKKMWNNYIIQ